MLKNLKMKVENLATKIRTVIALLVLMTWCSINMSAQQVRLSFKEATLKTVLKEMTKQTGYNFVYSEELINSNKLITLTLNTNAEPIEALLNKVFSGLSISYQIKGKQIALSPIVENSSQSEKKISIKGTIKDEAGVPLSGAYIYVKNNKTLMAYTDLNGNFSIQISEKYVNNAVFVCSYIGMKQFELPVDGRGIVHITMKTDERLLEDVVVTGYQTISKERATGSFDIINKKQLDKPVSSPSTFIIGTTAGVQAKIADDGSASFEIRGKSTLNATTSTPLVVVDGFPTEGGFSSVNPNDVESITILKDAASASIWGARAGNGVIVIKTKKPTKGSLNVTFNTFIKSREKLDLSYVDPVASSADEIEYEQYMFGKYGAILGGGQVTQTDMVQKKYSLVHLLINEARLGKISTTERDAKLEELRNIDYKDDLYKYVLRNPFSVQSNLSISGGTEKINFLTSLMYEDNKSYYVGTDNNRYLINSRVSANIAKWLTFDVATNFQYGLETNNGMTLTEIKRLSPYERLVNPDGTYAKIVYGYYQPTLDRISVNAPYKDWYYNPLEDSRNRDFTTKLFNVNIRPSLTFNIIEGLSFNTTLQYEIYNTYNRNLYYEGNYVIKDLINFNTQYTNGVYGKMSYPKGQILDRSSVERNGYTFRNQLNFVRSFKKHDINFVAGTEIRSRTSDGSNYARVYGYNDETLVSSGFPNGLGGTGDNMLYNIFGSSIKITNYTNSFSSSTDRFFSMYGNAAYTYNGKYTLSASARTDASNFISDDPNYRYAIFWSAGAAWNITDEDFMKEYKFIDRLRFRATFGYNGNVETSTSFKPLISLSSVVDPYKNELTASISSYGNPTLRWERISCLDLGLDYSFLKGKIAGKIEYYDKYSKDLIASITIPSLNGSSTQKFNNAELLNRGFEVEAGTNLNIINKDISWFGKLTYAYNFNRIEKLKVYDHRAETFITVPQYKEGTNTSTVYGWKYLGLNEAGVPCVEGVGGKATPMNTYFDNTSDARGSFKALGLLNAPHNLGFVTGFKIYDFDISMTVTGKFGYLFKRGTFAYSTMGTTATSKMRMHKDIRKLLDGDPSVPPLYPNSNSSNNQFYYDQFYQRFMEDRYFNANHIRFQELNIAYNLPSKLLKKLGFKSSSIYGQINNIGVIAANPFGDDPEYPLGELKPSRTFILGLKFNL